MGAALKEINAASTCLKYGQFRYKKQANGQWHASKKRNRTHAA